MRHNFHNIEVNKFAVYMVHEEDVHAKAEKFSTSIRMGLYTCTECSHMVAQDWMIMDRRSTAVAAAVCTQLYACTAGTAVRGAVYV